MALRLPARLAILGAILVIEILTVSVWLDAEGLRGRGALANLLHDWGSWSVKLGVAAVLGSLIFAESRAKADFKRISEECSSCGIAWAAVIAHAFAFVGFLGFSAMVFRHTDSGSVANLLILGWGLAGLLAVGLAACILIPSRIWRAIFRSTGDAWAYGAGAALVACTLGILAQRLWIPLSHWTLDLVATMMRPFVPVLLVDHATMMIGTPAFHEEIAQQCSGYEGMGLILAFSSAWLWFFRRQWRFPHALLLIPAGLALIWVANAMRIAALMLIGNAGAPQIAEGGFHSQAGWMAFNAVAIGICVLARRIPALVRHDGEIALEAEAANPTASYLMPFLAILAAAMVSRSMSADFEWPYGLRVAAAAGALFYFRRSYRDVDWRMGWTGVLAGVAVFALWIGLEPLARSTAHGAPAAFLQASASGRLTWLIFRIIGGVAMVPIAEELAFRGFLMRRLISGDFESAGWRTFSWTAILISSLAFGIMHGERWLAGTIAGAIFALAQLRRGRIGDAIAAHAVANALVAAWVLIHGNWQLW